MKKLILLTLLTALFSIQTYAEYTPKTGGSLPPAPTPSEEAYTPIVGGTLPSAPLSEAALKNLAPAQQYIELIKQFFNQLSTIKSNFIQLKNTATSGDQQLTTTSIEPLLRGIEAGINNLGSAITYLKDILLKLKPTDITALTEKIKKENFEKSSSQPTPIPVSNVKVRNSKTPPTLSIK